MQFPLIPLPPIFVDSVGLYAVDLLEALDLLAAATFFFCGCIEIGMHYKTGPVKDLRRGYYMVAFGVGLLVFGVYLFAPALAALALYILYVIIRGIPKAFSQ